MENKSVDGVDLPSLRRQFCLDTAIAPHPKDSSRWTEWKVTVDGRTSMDLLEVEELN